MQVASAAELLNAVLRGKHIKIDQTVQIGGAQGTKLTITDLEDVDSTVAPLQPEDIRNTNLDIPDAEGKVPPKPSKPVLPADLKPVKDAPANKAENLTPVKPKVENVKKETKAQTAQRLYDEFKGAATSTTAGTKAAELLAFKKASKKSWTALGLSDDIGSVVTEAADAAKPPVAVKKVDDFDGLTEKKAKPAKAGTPKAQMEALLKGGTINESIARDALAIKRSAKKSWAKLGVSDADVSENRCNTQRNRNNTSGFKGVYFHKPTQTWYGQVRKHGVCHSTNGHPSANAANEALQRIRQSLHGEFTNHGETL